MRFRREQLQGDNSASETDFQILNQLRMNAGDGQSQMEGVELIEGTLPPTRNARNATAIDTRPQEAWVDPNDPGLLVHSMHEREEAGILAASLSNLEGQSNDPGMSSLGVSYMNSNQNTLVLQKQRRSHETKSLLAGMKNALERI